MSNSLSKRIEITCHDCGRLFEVSVPSDVVSWEYIDEFNDYNFDPPCPHCGERTTIKLTKGKTSGRDNTRVY